MKTVNLKPYHPNDDTPVQPHELPRRAANLKAHMKRIRAEELAQKECVASPIPQPVPQPKPKPKPMPKPRLNPNMQIEGIAKRRCSICENFKPISAFSRHAGKASGLESACKLCTNARRRTKILEKRKKRTKRKISVKLKIFEKSENKALPPIEKRI